MNTLKVYIERGDDGRYSAYLEDCMSLPFGLIGEGDTVQETIDDWNAVYDAMSADYVAQGNSFDGVDFSFAYDVPSFLRYYAGKLSFAGLSKLTGVSASQLSQYANGFRNPSPRTTQKIQTALHAFGQELSQVQLV